MLDVYNPDPTPTSLPAATATAYSSETMAVLPPDPVFSLRCAEMGPVSSICFHQNERLLAGTTKGTVHLWDMQTNRSALSFEIGSLPVTAVHHTDDNLYTQEKGGILKSWDVTNSGYVLRAEMDSNHAAFCRSDFLIERNSLACPTSDNGISLLDLGDFSVQTRLTPDGQTKLGFVSCLKCVTINGQSYILAGYESGHILTWDLRCNKVINQLKMPDIVMALDYDVLTNRGVCGGPENRIYAIAYQRTSMELRETSEIGIKNAGINTLRIRKDQKVFVSGGSDSRIRIFSWKSLRPLAVLTEHKTGGIMDIAFTEGKVSMWNARIMAAGGADGQITLWDLYN